MQSDGKLKIASAGKNSDTGRQQTEEYTVEGPVMMFLTTTSETPDPELQNRCITLRVNETSQQTAAIHARQSSRFTLDGQKQLDDRKAIRELHQNAQRLLEPKTVLIPWADQFTFRQDQTRMRRDFDKYLNLIASITLLHQYQRETNDNYITATLDDISLANRLGAEALGQSLDELLPQTRQLLVLIDNQITTRAKDEQIPRQNLRFTQRQLRESLGWHDRSLRRHLQRLVELEYVLAYRTGRGNEREYQLLYNGQGREGERFLLGLIDIAKLRSKRKPKAPKRTGGQTNQTGTQTAGTRQPSGNRQKQSKAKPANNLPPTTDKPSKNGQGPSDELATASSS